VEERGGGYNGAYRTGGNNDVALPREMKAKRMKMKTTTYVEHARRIILK
jgi:hypothetical protein